MPLLQPAKMQITHAKVNMFGETGSGKTTLLALMLIYLSKKYHGGSEVAFFSTEPGVDYVIPIFEAEGVPLLLVRSQSFADLVNTAREAVARNVCAMGTDSLTRTWVELVDAYCKANKITRPEFQDWKALKGRGSSASGPMWADWTDLFVNSRMHMLTAGRAGYEYEYEENERGKRDLIKGDSKMKAEGEFGYEADLLIELSRTTNREQIRQAKKQGRRGGSDPGLTLVQHHLLVKKCRVWDLNDLTAVFASRKKYEPGYYLEIGKLMDPYFDMLAANRKLLGGATHNPVVDTSRTTHVSGANNAEYFEKKKLKDRWAAIMAAMFPSANATNQKHARQVIGEAIASSAHGASVRGAAEFNGLPVDSLRRAIAILERFETTAKAEKMDLTATIKDEDLVALCDMAEELLDAEIDANKKAENPNASLFVNEEDQVF